MSGAGFEAAIAALEQALAAGDVVAAGQALPVVTAACQTLGAGPDVQATQLARAQALIAGVLARAERSRDSLAEKLQAAGTSRRASSRYRTARY